jgi:hypothetical protein
VATTIDRNKKQIDKRGDEARWAARRSRQIVHGQKRAARNALVWIVPQQSQHGSAFGTGGGGASRIRAAHPLSQILGALAAHVNAILARAAVEKVLQIVHRRRV